MNLGEYFLSTLRFFGSLPQDTRFFVVSIAILGIALHARFTSRVIALGPTILTTLGIFATFFGIARGLSNFDATNVQASIPALLSGLKTAFWASVFGVGAALTLKVRELLQRPSLEEVDHTDATVGDLLRQMSGIREAISGNDDGSLISQMKLTRQDANKHLAPLQDIRRGLLGGEDSSLITQVRLMRQDMSDRMDALVAAQTQALQKLAEMGTGALIEALRDVIKDFNNRITEQFGENFRELNSAVRSLVTWQENYKTTIETTHVRMDELLTTLSKASNDFSVLVERANGFTDVAQHLGDLLTALTEGEQRLKVVAEGLGSLLHAASSSLPAVEQKVIELARQMSDGVRESQEIVREGMTASTAILVKTSEELRTQISTTAEGLARSLSESQRGVEKAVADSQNTLQTNINESATTFRTGVEALLRDVSTLSGELARSLLENQKSATKALSDNSAALGESIRSATGEMNKANGEFNRHLEDLLVRTRDQFKSLDAALAAELTRSLEGLGRQLTALSERFVQDYEPLTNKLRQVLELGRV